MESLVAVGIVLETARDRSETIDERISGAARPDVAIGAEKTGSVSSAVSSKVLLGFRTSLIRLDTLGSAEIGMLMDTDSITSVVTRGDPTL